MSALDDLRLPKVYLTKLKGDRIELTVIANGVERRDENNQVDVGKLKEGDVLELEL